MLFVTRASLLPEASSLMEDPFLHQASSSLLSIEMASQPVQKNVPSLTRSLTSHNSAVSDPSDPEETWNATWKINKIKNLLGKAMKEKESFSQGIIAKLPFKMGATFGHEVSLEWVLQVCDNNDAIDPEDNDVASTSDENEPKTIGLVLYPKCPVNRSGHDDPWPNLYFLASIKIILAGEVVHKEEDEMADTFEDNGWAWMEMVRLSKLRDYLDSEGSMSLKISLEASYRDPNGAHGLSTTKVRNEDCKVSLEEKFLEKEPMMKKVACLLGNKEISDVSISIVNENNEEIARFPSHSTILSTQSVVFRAMFTNKGMAERRHGVVTMNDVSPEVVDQFLSFLYTGRFKNKRKANENGFVEVWKEILPQLVYMADKYSVEDLLEFCDLHFHIAVNEGNALEMYKLAGRHRLTRAQARLREDFKKSLN